MNSPDKHPAVELRGLTKRFGTVLANADINLRIERGTIHGIVGENGAGKSTSMKILYGLYQPDAGEIFLNGLPRGWSSPSDAIAAGIGMVHQHFMLAGTHSALDNIVLGAEPSRFGFINREAATNQLNELAEKYGLRVGWDQPVEEMPVGVQQRIEILKLLYRQADILILDEPTAVLTPQETKLLFDNLKRLRQQGKTILFVTHKLREIMAFTDRVTVLRAGKVVAEVETTQTNPHELAEMMVGRKVSLQASVSSSRGSNVTGLEAIALTHSNPGESRHRLRDVTFQVRSGEIVGIAGVEGNGQSELLQALLHPADRACRSSGQVKILGTDVTHWTPRRIRELGIAFIPEDRLHEGLLPERPLLDNFLLGQQNQSAFRRGPFLNFQTLRNAASTAIQQYDVRPSDLNLPAASLSGGNQQKLIAAREFHQQVRILIAAQLTRGVDVGAIEFIHKKIVQVRDAGAAVLLISSELEEILALADRILVMYEGRIVAEFQRGRVTETELGLKMGGEE